MKIIIGFILSFYLLSCGNSLSTSTKDSKSSIVQGSTSSCLCNTNYFPVCGSNDKKSYENACLAKCFGNSSYTAGNCQCNADLLVCGVDGQSYTECEAKTSNIALKKYVACDYAEL